MEHSQIPIGYFGKKWHKTFWKMKCLQVRTFFFVGNVAHAFMLFKCVIKYTIFFLLGCFHHLKNR
jgi:hypothetical protein